MTTIQALQDLYAALGGTASDVENINTIPAMLNALAEIAGSTIELPAVSSTDNGDILTVVEGKWAKAEAPEELPAVTTSDEGDALIVDSEGKWAKSAIPSQLPAVTSADAGDALIVDSEGKWAKAEIPKFVLSTINNATAAAELLEQISTLENWQSILFEYNDTYNLPYAITWNDDDEAEQLDVYINTSTGITKKTYTTAGVTTVSAALTFE